MNPTSWFRAGEDSGLKVLWEDGERVFCRKESHADGYRAPVLVVLPAAEHPTAVTLDRLAREYALKDELDGTWAVRPLELVRERGRIMLVLEDTRGEPLDQLLGLPMEVRSFLRLAIAVAAAVSQVHRRDLVHKDIKPANILVNRTTGEVKLTGFGIASRLPRERQAPAPPESIAGTLAYMAPEQTGRMNRSIDARSDLYAVGVTFYQMLTGSLPFTAVDPMEWVHCHIARKPEPPSERLETVPVPVSALILKLLAKNAEERYQTAAGVEWDLRRCLAQLESGGRIDDFPLGQQDTPDRLLIPEKLYGRAREVETLLAAFDRVVVSGRPELVLVSGYSGIGKSAVVNELHKALVPPRGLFASGKFDQYKRDIPYATLVQAFQSLVRPLLSRSDAELSSWRDALVEALGANGRLMVDLVPELKLIVGEPPPVPELPPQQAQARFQLVFRRFIGVFARQEHPLALFLDDLQWLDAATLDLLEDLLTQSDLRHLMLIGAYRDNEVDGAHPLTRKLDAIRQAGARVQEIRLAPLVRDDLRQVIVDALRCESERAAPLAQLVHDKTGGNPFFALQFISALAEEGLLRFDHDAARWRWDVDRLHAKGYTDNVVELMVGKLTRLPTETQAALQQLACLGNIGEITMLSIVLGKSNEDVRSDLWDAVRLELLVEHLDGSYKFVHDRVQEAAYSLIPERLRAEAHLRVGRLLAAHTPAERREEAIFDIVNQLNRGAALITSQGEREQLAEFNLLAGQRAKASAAYASALTYFIAGAALLAEDSWECRHDLTFALQLNRAECEFLTGALAEAEARSTALSTRAANTVEHATVACLREELFTTLDRSDRSVDVALDYLRRVGVAWSAHPTQDEVRREYELMWQQIGSRPIEALLDLPRMADPVWRATMDVLSAVVSPALYTDQNLYNVVIGRMANLSLQHGNTDASSYAYAILGTVLGAQFGDYKAAFRFSQVGFNLAAQRGLDRFKARVYLIFGHHVMPWTKPIRTSRSLMRFVLDAAQEAGDLTYGAFGHTHLSHAPSRQRRSARRGAARGRGRARLRASGAVRSGRRQDHRAVPVDPDTARPDPDLRPLRRRRVRRGAVRAASGGGSAARARRLLVLDPQVAGARPRRRPRCGDRGGGEGGLPASGRRQPSSSGRSTISTPRWHGLRAATQPPMQSGPGMSRLWSRTTDNSRSGRQIVRRISSTAPHWSGRKSPGSKAAHSMPWTFTNRPSAWHVQTALSTTKRSPTNWPRASTRRVASKSLQVSICGTRATAMSVGELMERCGNSNNFIHISARQQSRHLPPPPLGRPSSSWMSERWSRLRRRCPARSSSVNSSRRCCGSRSSMPAPSVACSSCSRATSRGSQQKRRPAAASLRLRFAMRSRRRRSFPKPCFTP